MALPSCSRHIKQKMHGLMTENVNLKLHATLMTCLQPSQTLDSQLKALPRLLLTGTSTSMESSVTRMISSLKPTNARNTLESAAGPIPATMRTSGTLRMWLAALYLSRELLKATPSMRKLATMMIPLTVATVIEISASGVGLEKTHLKANRRRLSAAASQKRLNMSSVMNMVSASTIISVSVALTVALANGLGPRGTKMSKLHKTQPSDASPRLSKRSSLAKNADKSTQTSVVTTAKNATGHGIQVITTLIKESQLPADARHGGESNESPESHNYNIALRRKSDRMPIRIFY